MRRCCPWWSSWESNLVNLSDTHLSIHSHQPSLGCLCLLFNCFLSCLPFIEFVISQHRCSASSGLSLIHVCSAPLGSLQGRSKRPQVGSEQRCVGDTELGPSSLCLFLHIGFASLSHISAVGGFTTLDRRNFTHLKK